MKRSPTGMSVSSSALASISTVLRSGCGWLTTVVAPSRLSVKPSLTPCAIGALAPAGERVVLRDQLHEVADALELDDLVAQHHSAVDALLADAAAQVGREQIRRAELVGRDLDPDLLVLLPRAEETRHFLRVLDHFGERLRAGRGGRGRAGRLRDARRRCARTRAGDIARRHAGRHRGRDFRGVGRRLRRTMRPRSDRAIPAVTAQPPSTRLAPASASDDARARRRAE